jgi:hypothetical protein
MIPLHPPVYRVANIIPEDTGLFQLTCGGGMRARILRVVDRANEPIDDVAWCLEDPSCWWLDRRTASILGEAEVFRADFLGLPLHLMETPDEWLRNHDKNGRWPAACILNWDEDPRFSLGAVPEVRCTTHSLARHLFRRLVQVPPVPFSISVHATGPCAVA